MNNRWTVPIVIVVALIAMCLGCSSYFESEKHLHPQLDQRSYEAGYISAGPMLVEQGMAATSACQQALQAAMLLRSDDFEPFDEPSFNSGCYAAIRAHGDPVKNDTGGPVNAS